MSLSDYSMSEYRDAEFFENVFPLKRNVPDVEPSTISKQLKLPIPRSNDEDPLFEPRRSKRHRIETSFGPDFITAFLVETFEAFGVDALTEEFVSIFLIEEDPKIYQEAVRSIDATF